MKNLQDEEQLQLRSTDIQNRNISTLAGDILNVSESEKE